MIYWFTGNASAGKTTLAKKLHNFLKTEKRNWRKDVFHLDGDDLRALTVNEEYSEQGRVLNVKNAQMIAEYLHMNGCDVVVSMISPYRLQREEFKSKLANGDFQEIYIHTSDERANSNFKVAHYEPPLENFLDIDTTKDSPNVSFSKIITQLDSINKI